MKDVAESTANCYYVTAQGLTANPDAIHINATSQRLLGMRYFAAFSKRVDITQPLSQESDAERVLYKKDFTKNEQMYLLVSKFSKNEITYDAFIEGMAELQ